MSSSGPQTTPLTEPSKHTCVVCAGSSFAEVNVNTYGLSVTKKKTTCAKKRKGKCVKKKTKKTNLFWFTEPKCPPNNQLPFQSFYQYENGLAQTSEVTVPCPAFKH